MTEKDELHEELKKLEKIIPLGDINAKLNWCSIYYSYLYDEIDHDIAERMRRFYQEGADRGIPYAALNLGAMYYSGDLIECDYQKALKYYRIAAEQDDDLSISAHAYANMGYCYMYGRDMPVDHEKAYECFKIGIEADPSYIVNQYKLSDMYRYGLYVEKDDDKALKHYLAAMVHLHESEDNLQSAGDIYKRIGECYLDGIGTEKNKELALKYLYKARALLETEAKRDYVFAYGIIDAIDKDIARAEQNENS